MAGDASSRSTAKWRRLNAGGGVGGGDGPGLPPLAPWPVGEPPGWAATVDEPDTPAELAALRLCLSRGRPYGSDAWAAEAAARLGLAHTLRPRGRPRKAVRPAEARI